jgi:hypothetical protein
MLCDTNNLIRFVIGKVFAMYLIRLDIVQLNSKIYNFIQITHDGFSPLHILHYVGVLAVQANALGILWCVVEKLQLHTTNPALHTHCSESDSQLEVHAFLDEIVQLASGYGCHCKLLVFGF